MASLKSLCNRATRYRISVSHNNPRGRGEQNGPHLRPARARERGVIANIGELDPAELGPTVTARTWHQSAQVHRRSSLITIRRSKNSAENFLQPRITRLQNGSKTQMGKKNKKHTQPPTDQNELFLGENGDKTIYFLPYSKCQTAGDTWYGFSAKNHRLHTTWPPDHSTDGKEGGNT